MNPNTTETTNTVTRAPDCNGYDTLGNRNPRQTLTSWPWQHLPRHCLLSHIVLQTLEPELTPLVRTPTPRSRPRLPTPPPPIATTLADPPLQLHDHVGLKPSRPIPCEHSRARRDANAAPRHIRVPIFPPAQTTQGATRAATRHHKQRHKSMDALRAAHERPRARARKGRNKI